MEVKSFMYNLLNIAKAPAVENLPPVQVSKKEMKEMQDYLEEVSCPVTVDNEQEMRFMWNGVNFTVIENDREEEVGLGGKVVEKQKYVAVLSEEDQAVVDKNTDTAGAEVSNEVSVDVVQEARANSTILTDEEIAAKEQENNKSDKGAAKGKSKAKA